MNPVPLPVTAEALPASRKIHEPGQLHPGIRVPMREITMHPSAKEPPLRVYDSSGPYTDPGATIDIRCGLPRLRDTWIRARSDVGEYAGRAMQPGDNGVSPNQDGYVPEFPVRSRP